VIGRMVVCDIRMPVIDDRLIEPQTALDTSPSMKPAAVLVNFFLNEESCAFGASHVMISFSMNINASDGTALRYRKAVPKKYESRA
jgi:hypothetical protein